MPEAEYPDCCTPETKNAPSLFVNDDLTVHPEDGAKLLAFYKRSNLIHQLVKILSNSPDFARLEMPLDIEVLAQYDMSLDSDSEDSGDEGETQRKMTTANERAIELFLECGILTPLGKLSNVRSFEFGCTAPVIKSEVYKPTLKHDRMLSDLTQKIEHNYAVRDD